LWNVERFGVFALVDLDLVCLGHGDGPLTNGLKIEMA
jgi:hypothetical protein